MELTDKKFAKHIALELNITHQDAVRILPPHIRARNATIEKMGNITTISPLSPSKRSLSLDSDDEELSGQDVLQHLRKQYNTALRQRKEEQDNN